MWWLWPKFLSENDLLILPFGCVYFHLTDITRYRLIYHPDQHSIFCYFPWVARPKFQKTPPWDRGFIKWQFFELQNDLNFCLKYSYTNRILKSLPASCVTWFYHQSQPVHYFPPLLYLSLSLVKTKGRIEILYVDELWGCSCHRHCPQLQFHNQKTSEECKQTVVVFHHSYAKPWLLPKTVTKEKKEGYRNQRSVCCNHVVLWMWSRESLRVCNLRPKHPASKSW